MRNPNTGCTGIKDVLSIDDVRLRFVTFFNMFLITKIPPVLVSLTLEKNESNSSLK